MRNEQWIHTRGSYEISNNIIHNGLYAVATPERDTFFRLQVSERVGISLVGAHNRVGKSVISVCFRRPLGSLISLASRTRLRVTEKLLLLQLVKRSILRASLESVVLKKTWIRMRDEISKLRQRSAYVLSKASIWKILKMKMIDWFIDWSDWLNIHPIWTVAKREIQSL